MVLRKNFTIAMVHEQIKKIASVTLAISSISSVTIIDVQYKVVFHIDILKLLQ